MGKQTHGSQAKNTSCDIVADGSMYMTKLKTLGTQRAENPKNMPAEVKAQLKGSRGCWSRTRRLDDKERLT